MTDDEARYSLNRIRYRYATLRLTEIILAALAVSLLVYAILDFTKISRVVQYAVSVAAAWAVVLTRILQLSLLKVTNHTIAAYLSQQYHVLEESADLLLRREDELSLLQRIQKFHVIQNLEDVIGSVRLPHHLGQSITAFAISGAILLATIPFKAGVGSHSPGPTVNNLTPQSHIIKVKPVELKNATIVVRPPAYTRLASSESRDRNLLLPEGSDVTWSLDFSGEILNGYLIFSGKDSIALLRKNDNIFSARKVLMESGFYQTSWVDNMGQWRQSDFYTIETLKDTPPKISIRKPLQFTELVFSDNLLVELEATISDDYGLKDALIVATVSKGSGESVKFREESIRFSRPVRLEGKSAEAQQGLDLHKLGMEPGDELYFYVEAWDNKVPVPNRARTETFFVALQDTATAEIIADAGLGVDLMPEYFRSQRQIIIDSEKLLEEQKSEKVTPGNFNSRSNELGYDQKVLRLRYGQFMGEEFETGGPPDESESDNDATEDDIRRKYGHEHDTENEHNLVPEKSGTGNASLGLSIRAKLKAALTLMWDAELHLRLFDPARSLPFQYRILKLLKEISNDSRIYVRRTGFDPPPLKEDKRLTGNLTEIGNSTVVSATVNNLQYPGLRRLLPILEIMLSRDSVVITPTQKRIFLQAGQELAGAAIQEPAKYLHCLSLIKALVNSELEASKIKSALMEIRASCWKILPAVIIVPTQQRITSHKLDETFVHQLEQLKHE